MEITNTSDGPVALTAISPWTGILLAHPWVLPHLPPERADRAFTLGYFHESHRRIETGHGMEGRLEWEALPLGTTEIGCDKGQCYDDPFFVVRNEAQGEYTICHLAWSANWYATFECQDEGGMRTLRFKIGPKATDALCVLSPGETTVSPAVHLGSVADDLDATVQAMHEHIRSTVLPALKPERSHLVQYSCPGDQGYLSKHFGDRSDCTSEKVMENVDIAAALEAELFIMDAAWWDNQGDWYASPRRFPNGLQEVVDYVHEKGMLFGLYAEIERAHPGSQVHKEHPDWIGPGNVLKMNRPEVAAHVESALIGIIEDYDIDLLRLDHNKASIMEGSTTEKDGYVENDYWRYYEAFYGMMERIHEKYPDLILQQAACGGARNDLGTAGRFHETYLTDGLQMPYMAQNYSGQTLALPPEIFIIAAGANGGGSIGFPENIETYMRVTFTLSTPWIFAGMVAPSIEELNPDRLEGFLRYGKIYKEFIRPILPTCKTYHHAPISDRGGVESSGWFAMEFAAPDGSKGWATIIRVGPTESDTYLFKSQGLRPDKEYRVTIDSLDATFVENGLALIRDGLPTSLKVLSKSELLLFEEVE
jgi:alpha-galactosidase